MYDISVKLFLNIKPVICLVILRIIEESRRVINEHLISVIEGQRETIANGFPLLGIPPLDPYHIQGFETHIDGIGVLGP